MGRVQRLIVRGVLGGVVARPRLTLAIAGAAVLACAAWAYLRLDISTDTNRLFNPNVPFFADYLEFDRKFPENEAIYVVIEPRDPKGATPDPARWTGAADAIEAALAALPGHVRRVEARIPLEQLGDQGLLFESPEAVRQRAVEVRRFIPLVRIWAERPRGLERVFGAAPMDQFLSKIQAAPPDAETARFVGALAESWTRTLERSDGGGNNLSGPVDLPDLARLDARTPRDLGYFYEPDASDQTRSLLLIRVFPVRTYRSLTAISQTVEAIRGAARAAAAPFGEFAVGVTGRPALEADEMRTTDRDSTLAEVVALSVVFVGLVVALRSVWLALAAEISLGVAIGWTFGWAELAVGELNLLSIVFLIALIGIGMDYLVQVLVRYRQEAARRASPRGVWARVFRHVGPPINTACLGAAGAFLVAMLTDFRGAAQLGIIAGGGLLLCLLSAYTVLPAILTLAPARRLGRSSVRANVGTSGVADGPGRAAGAGHARDAHSTGVGFVAAAPAGGWRLLTPVVWVTLLVAGAVLFAPRTGFNPNLLDLQAPDLESVKLVRKLQTFSAVVLSRDLNLLRKVRDAVDGSPAVARTESILDAYDNAAWLARNAKLPSIEWAEPEPVTPRALPGLAAKARAMAKRFGAAAPEAATGPDAAALLEAARALNEFADRASAAANNGSRAAVASGRHLSGWQVGFAAQLRQMLRQFNPGPPRIGELPAALRAHFVAEDGTVALYIHPAEDLWRREPLARFVADIERQVRAVPGAPAPTGIALNIHYTTAAIERSFYRATAYALALIFVLVLIDLRSIWQTLLAISVLALGLPMLVALMGLTHVLAGWFPGWVEPVDWNFANFFGLPILIGAGHEYGVFMVHRYREARGDPRGRRVWRRGDASDRALLLCAYVTCSSFGFFWWFADHRGLRSLGLVMALGTACIYLATVLALRPLLLWRLRVRRGGAGEKTG